MELELIYDSADQIPSGYEALFTERGGKWHLTGVRGMKTQGDIDRLKTSLDKEREEHSATKEKLRDLDRAAGGKGAEELQEILDEIEELKIKASGKDSVDEAKIEELVSRRVDREVSKIQRKLDKSETELGEMTSKHTQLVSEIERRDLRSHLETVGRQAKIRPEAMDDWLLFGSQLFEREEGSNSWVAKDGVGVSPGLPAETVLGDLMEKRSHWWPESQGAGAKGGKGGGGGAANPWSKGNWNVTEQGAYVRKHGMEKAQTAAESAGSRIGATRPPEST